MTLSIVKLCNIKLKCSVAMGVCESVQMSSSLNCKWIHMLSLSL